MPEIVFPCEARSFCHFCQTFTRPLLRIFDGFIEVFFFLRIFAYIQSAEIDFYTQTGKWTSPYAAVHERVKGDMWYVYSIYKSNIFISHCLGQFNICWSYSRVENNQHYVSISLRNSLWETKLFLTEFGISYLGFFGCFGAVLLKCYLWCH